MRTLTLTTAIALVLGLVAGGAPVAIADDEADIGGVYDVTYEEVTNNCSGVGMALSRSALTIDQKKGSSALTVTIPMVPDMTGSLGKNGKFKASSKRGRSAVQGLDGKHAVGGRVDNGLIQVVFIAEYFKGNKPFCTQSWNVSGLKKR